MNVEDLRPRGPAWMVWVFSARKEPHDDGDAFLAGSCELTAAAILATISPLLDPQPGPRVPTANFSGLNGEARTMLQPAGNGRDPSQPFA